MVEHAEPQFCKQQWVQLCDWLLIVSPLSDKSKRRTKTVKKSVEPRWNQTFMYSPVHRREFAERMLELTVWDQARVREEESQFLGEVRTHREPDMFPRVYLKGTFQRCLSL